MLRELIVIQKIMNKLKGLWGIIAAVVLIAVIGVGLWYISKPVPKNITTFQECADAGYPVMESYPRQCRTPKGESFTEEIGNELELTDLIQITNPRPNQTLTSYTAITGKAQGSWFFEASFPIKLLVDDKEIATAIATADGDWMTTEFVNFTATLVYTPTKEIRQAKLIFQKDNPSDLPANDNALIMPVTLGAEEPIIRVFFGKNTTSNTSNDDCRIVVPVTRGAYSDINTSARTAVEELLKGPTETEKNSGYFTSINPDVKIQKFSIEDGIAKVDFDKQLEFQMGGSCRVSAIRAQITQTLKQFPEIREVIISIDGRTEDILQP
jgi:hypothetical protein